LCYTPYLCYSASMKTKTFSIRLTEAQIEAVKAAGGARWAAGVVVGALGAEVATGKRSGGVFAPPAAIQTKAGKCECPEKLVKIGWHGNDCPKNKHAL
jgi:hypothetical protein